MWAWFCAPKKQEGITISRVNDLWWSKDKTTGEKVKTARHGKGLRWQAVWTDGRGGERKKSHKTKDAALGWIKDQDQKQLAGHRVGGPQLTVEEAAKLYLQDQTQWSPKTRFNAGHTIEVTVVNQFGHQLLAEVSTQGVREWVRELQMTVQASTLTTYFSRFRAFMNWCVDEGYIPVAPTHRVKLPKSQKRKQHFLTPTQFWEFQAAFDPHFHDALETAVTTGVRPGELWEFRGMDVGQKPGRVRVERSVTEVNGRLVIGPTKTGQPRDAPVLEHVEAMLLERAKKVGPDGLLFEWPGGGQVVQLEFHKKFLTPAVEQVGLPEGFRLYDLRHTAASWAIREGASVLAVQRMLGHAKPTETLNTYAHLFDDELDQVTASISKMLDRHRSATDGREAA